MARLLSIHALTHINSPMVLLSFEEYAVLVDTASRRTNTVKSARPSRKLLKLLAGIRRSKGPVFNSAKSFRHHLNKL